VLLGRVTTVLLMGVAMIFALLLSNALQAFNIVLQIGAGTGLIFILRWFWWRINAFSEITAMSVSFFIALYFQFVHPLTGLPELTNAAQLVAGVAITTIAWVTVTLFTKPTDTKTLREFYRLVRPGGPGWKKVVRDAAADNDPLEPVDKKGWNVPMGILSMVLGCLLVYSILFATGNWIYGKYTLAIILTIVAFFSGVLLITFWRKTVNS
ncbi:MAG: hypothetical protein KAT48_10195, partial [Bacteroidales bacterium]|nr:hypothetical protein [Bacteroidales bacterium]